MNLLYSIFDYEKILIFSEPIVTKENYEGFEHNTILTKPFFLLNL